MQILLLGSGAAEGWPAPYCECSACSRARAAGGRNIRSRTGALVDNDLKIDHGPDTLMQMQREGRSLAAVRTIVFTHEHGDHLAAPELEWASRPFTLTPPARPIDVYGNERVLDEIHRVFPDPSKINLSLHLLKALEPVVTPQGDRILPLRADHSPGTLVLRITRGSRTIFYGHDSGLYPPETLDALSDGIAIDVAIMDCNHGNAETSHRMHMGIDGVIAMSRELRKRCALTNTSRVIATHFSHNGTLLHEELARVFEPHQIEVAFDGMVVEI